MKRIAIPLILFFLLVIEGVAIEFLPSIFGELLIIPHWLFVFLVLMTIFYDRVDTYQSIVYAIIFGLLFDIVYTEILGVYMFTYSVVIYLIHSIMKLLHSNFYSTLLMVIVGVVSSDVIIKVIYMVIGVTDTYWEAYFMERLIPTILANILFLFILYPLIKRFLVKWSNEQLPS